VVTWERVVELACELPEVEVGPSWGRPALKVRGKTFAGTSRHEGAIWIRCDPTSALAAGSPACCAGHDDFRRVELSTRDYARRGYGGRSPPTPNDRAAQYDASYATASDGSRGVRRETTWETPSGPMVTP
jgi:hypothetical protein